MPLELNDSQTKIYELLKEKNKESNIRPNFILTGECGVGKTYLCKYAAEKLNGNYINFVDEYGDDFLDDIDFNDIDGTDFLQFIKKVIINNTKNEFFLIDEAEFIFININRNNKMEHLLNVYKRMVFENLIVFVIPQIFLKKENLNNDNIIILK